MLHEGSMCLYKSGSGSVEAHGILPWQETEDIPWILVEYRNHRQLWSVESKDEE